MNRFLTGLFMVKKNSFSRWNKIFVLSLFLISTSLLFLMPIASADDAVLLVNISSDYDTREPGKKITFDITYSNSSTTVDAEDAKVTYTIPSGLAYVANSTGGSADVDHVDVSGDEVTFYFTNPLPAGSTGYVQVMMQFPDGITPDNTTVDNVVDFTATNAAAVTGSVSVTSDTKAPDWRITKRKVTPPSDPVPGQPVKYSITLYGNSSGGLNLREVRIEDRLPANVSNVEPSDSGNYDSATGKVVWDIGDLNVGGSVTRTVTYTYDYAHYTISSNARNDADGFGKLFGDDNEISVTGYVTHGFQAPNPETEGFRKSNRPSQTNEEYSIGQTAIYELDSFGNSGNVPLKNFYIEDDIPLELNLTSITTGRTSTAQDVTISYQSDLTTGWQTWATQPTDSNRSLSVESLGLDSNDYVTNVRWHFGEVPIGFNDSGDIRLNATILAVSRADNVTPVTEVRNTARLYWEYEGTDYNKDSNEAVFFTTGQRPWFDPRKTIADDTLNYGDTAEYTLTLRNHSYATGSLDNPVGIDVLPIYVDPDDGSYYDVLENITWTWEVGNSGLDKATVGDPVFTTTTKVIDGKNRTVLRWEFNHPDVKLGPGKYINVKLNGRIKDQTHTGVVGNQFYLTTNATADIKQLSSLVNDTHDLDGDGQTDDKLYPVSRDMFVIFQGSLESDKWVKGELDAVWTQYADPNDGVGNTLPGGVADYQLHVRNPGSNGPISNLVIIDLLPQIGDKGLIDTRARDTMWNPYLVDRIKGENGGALPAGITVYYSTNPRPSMTELYDPKNNHGSSGDGWSTTPPEDITKVRSLKIDFGSMEFEPGDTVIVEWPMRAPIGAPAGQIAWNSFAYAATYPGYQNGAVVDKPFLPAEPTKVGFKVQPHPGATVDLGNFVWHDLDSDGIQDSGEEGIDGVIVNLYRYDQTPGVDAPIAFTRTGDHHNGQPGYYGFPDIPPNNYYVEFIYPERYYLSPEKVGGNDAVDSDVLAASMDTSGGLTKVVTGLISVNQNNYNVDMGLYLAAEIGDTVWYDLNSNGIQDSGEQPVPNVDVRLMDTGDNRVNDIDGSLVNDQTTNASGMYKFSNLRPGNYKLQFSNLPAGYIFTTSGEGNDEGNDSDADSSGMTSMVSAVSDRSILTMDAGIHAASLGNYVFLDMNRDGIQNAGDLPVQGVTVRLLSSTDVELETDTTDSSGLYLFQDIAPGDYRVKFDIPTGYLLTERQQGGDTTLDSDPDTTTATTELITLTPGEIDETVDAGLCYIPSSIGDHVWRDNNTNGQQDSGEPGIDGVTVNLLDTSNNVLKTTTTAGGGQYLFDILNPGQYRVQVVPPTGYVFTGQDQGNDTTDSDITAATGRTNNITLGIDEHNMTNDAGLYVLTTLGNRVWLDKNGDGRQGSGEPGVSGVQVELLDDSANIIKTTHTDTSGLYQFTSLQPGTYSVRFTLPSDHIFTDMDSADDDEDSDANTITGETSQVTLNEGDINDTLDAGIRPLYSIGDRVWIDANTNGLQDSGELDKNGVTVMLMDAVSGLEFARTMTATDPHGNSGYYRFDNVPMGRYYIRAALPSNYSITRVNQGGNDGIDSDGYIAAGMARTETIDLTQDIVVVDLGLVDLIQHPNWDPPTGPIQNPKTGDFD